MGKEMETLHARDSIDDQEIALRKTRSGRREEFLCYGVVRLEFEMVHGAHGQDSEDKSKLVHEQDGSVGRHVSRRLGRVRIHAIKERDELCPWHNVVPVVRTTGVIHLRPLKVSEV